MRLSLIVCLALAASSAFAQSPPDPDFERQRMFDHYRAFRDSLTAVAARGDASEVAALRDALVDAGQVPFAHADSVAFLYFGRAGSVLWCGDLNGWCGRASGAGTHLGGDVWMWETTLPADARTDYKVVVDGSWRTDPRNPLLMWSGIGTANSELRMPEYAYPLETVERAGTPRGTLGEELEIVSAALGYRVRYRVYTPPGYDAGMADLPVVYATDGHEYAADHLGTMPTALDNLIADGVVAPLVVVFIDPRDPGSGHNRRQDELVANPAYLEFVADELVPAIDAAYRTDGAPGARAILGTSLGGLNAAYFATHRPDVFGRFVAMSPALWAWEQKAPGAWRAAVDAVDAGAVEGYVTVGTLGDDDHSGNGDGGSDLAARLEGRGVRVGLTVTNEGHSWGQWRALYDDALGFLFPADDGVTTGEARAPGPGMRIEAVPNPVRSSVRLTIAMGQPQAVRVDLYDSLGRHVRTLAPRAQHPGGEVVVRADLSDLAGGVYLVRARGEHRVATLRVVRV